MVDTKHPVYNGNKSNLHGEGRDVSLPSQNRRNPQHRNTSQFKRKEKDKKLDHGARYAIILQIALWDLFSAQNKGLQLEEG
jgi:hypothetical protein